MNVKIIKLINHFYLKCPVNKQNCKTWSIDNREVITQVPLHSECVTIWCEMTASTIFGQYFFEDGNGKRYDNLLRDFSFQRYLSYNWIIVGFNKMTLHTIHQRLA